MWGFGWTQSWLNSQGRQRGEGLGEGAHLMMAQRQSIRSCFSCLETEAQLSGDSSSPTSDATLGHILFGSSLGGRP